MRRSPPSFPIFLRLADKPVLVVGADTEAAAKVPALLECGARVTVVAPHIPPGLFPDTVTLSERRFEPSDLTGVWYVVASAGREVNRQVARAAAERQIFVNAVDDLEHATAYLGGRVQRGGITLAISSNGASPGLVSLIRRGLDAVLPADLEAWSDVAATERKRWRRDGTPWGRRVPELLAALNRLYGLPNQGGSA